MKTPKKKAKENAMFSLNCYFILPGVLATTVSCLSSSVTLTDYNIHFFKIGDKNTT